ncbi:hypothetical protein I4U23_011108 [Adineta vaga]|nr:hypothetical protein I4U23_011108 [Adineta vaga]
MSFEILPDEILLMIYSYLNGIEILEAFNDLNIRLNSTISNHRKHINLTRKRYGEFNRYCRMLAHTNLGLQVQTFNLSNTDSNLDLLTLFRKQVWRLDEKLPNLECLTLLDIKYDGLHLFLSNIMSLEKLTELNITCDRTFSNDSISECFHKLIRNIHSLRKLKLKNIRLSLGSVDDGHNDTITDLTIEIETTDDLVILLHHFRNLHYLSVSIENFQALHAQQTFDHISQTQLNEFHLEILHAPDRSTLEKFIFVLVNISGLRHVKFQICLDPINKNEDAIDYLNGEEWDRIRMQFDHLLNFDCTLWAASISYDVDDLTEYVTDSFAQFSSWFVDVFETKSYFSYSYSYVCVFTNTRRLCGAEIKYVLLNKRNGQEIATLIERISSLQVYTVKNSYVNDEDTIESPSLILPDRVFSQLERIEVYADSYMYFTERLESFLKQLFSRTSNLKSIEISSAGSDDDFNDIEDVLNCFEKPSMSITHCEFIVKADYDESRMKQVLFHLPMLTYLKIEILYAFEDFIATVNTCLIHAKYLFYLELPIPYQIRPKTYGTMKENIQLWLKENTLLGDSIVGREFYAVMDRDIQIWF